MKSLVLKEMSTHSITYIFSITSKVVLCCYRNWWRQESQKEGTGKKEQTQTEEKWC